MLRYGRASTLQAAQSSRILSKELLRNVQIILTEIRESLHPILDRTSRDLALARSVRV